MTWAESGHAEGVKISLDCPDCMGEKAEPKMTGVHCQVGMVGRHEGNVGKVVSDDGDRLETQPDWVDLSPLHKSRLPHLGSAKRTK